MIYFEKLKIQEQNKKRRRTANIMLKTHLQVSILSVRIVKIDTYSLTYNWIFNAIDSPSKNSKCESSMETKVEKHVPSFSAYSDCAVEKNHILKLKTQHIYYENYYLEKNT